MKRIFGLALLALGLAGVFESSAAAKAPPGIGMPCRRVGRLEGYWMNPTRGPLYDYSSYFATLYPYLPGAQEYQWQATLPGQFGSAIAVLPTSPPHPPAGRSNVIEVRPGQLIPPATQPPTQLTPAQPTPGQPAPANSTPAKPTTSQSAPAQSFPVQSTPFLPRLLNRR